MIKKAAIVPSKLLEQTMQVKESLQLVQSPRLAKCHIQFENNPVEVDARVIGVPSVNFANQRTEQPNPKWRGDNCQYFVPANCDKWAAIAFASGGRGHDAMPLVTWQFVSNL